MKLRWFAFLIVLLAGCSSKHCLLYTSDFLRAFVPVHAVVHQRVARVQKPFYFINAITSVSYTHLKYWFPDIAGSDWLETLHFAMRDFKDESFISQFLSPKVMRRCV